MHLFMSIPMLPYERKRTLYVALQNYKSYSSGRVFITNQIVGKLSCDTSVVSEWLPAGGAMVQYMF